MSVLSAQVDELRQMAESVGLEVPQAATMMMGAADTIEGLESENAKLRELVRDMNTCLEHYEPDGSVGCEHCPLNNDAGNCDYEQRMRELGVTA